MACKAPRNQNKHQACSGGASFFSWPLPPPLSCCLPPTPRISGRRRAPQLLHLQTGKIFYRRAAMSRNNGKSPKLDLKLNLSLPTRGGTSRRVAAEDDSPKGSSSSSPPSSCLSSCSSSPEAASMVLAGCPRCLMYVMLSEEDPKCPKCKSAVLLDFLHGNTTSTNNNNNSSSNNNNKNNKTRKS